MQKHDPVKATVVNNYLISYSKGFAIEYACNCGCKKTFPANSVRGKDVVCFGTSIKAVKRPE